MGHGELTQTESTQNNEKFNAVEMCDLQEGVHNGLPIVPLKVRAIGSNKVFNTLKRPFAEKPFIASFI